MDGVEINRYATIAEMEARAEYLSELIRTRGEETPATKEKRLAVCQVVWLLGMLCHVMSCHVIISDMITSMCYAVYVVCCIFRWVEVEVDVDVEIWECHVIR